MNINPQELTILVIDDSLVDGGVYSGYILSRHSPQEPRRSAIGLAEALDLCQEYSPDLILLNFWRDRDRGRDFIAALQLEASNSFLPPIGILNEAVDREPGSAMRLERGLVAELFPTPPESIAEQLGDRLEERVSLTNKLANTTELLGQRDRELKAFAALASYDLRAPLKGIANLATWLVEDLEPCLTPDTRKQFDLLQSRVQRMSLLIEDLLQYTQADRRPITRVLVNVGELLTKIIDSFSLAAEFTIEIASPMPTLRTDRVSLRQVFANLIGNAIKHHDRADGRVRIVAQPQANCYLFEIIDDGPGIDPGDRERIFEVFQSLLPQKDDTSTGMGLAIAKKQIELQGGKIWVDSTPGVGSKFSFTWIVEASSLA